jgi:AcrR family transcriptional regulator
VRASLVEAASVLFAARGPSRVSVRQIADAAGVNHGLVHHYFGSKDGLLRSVLDELSERVATEIGEWDGEGEFLAVGGAVEQHGRIVAHLLLDAQDPAAVQTTFPALRTLVAHLRSRGVAPEQARERAAQVSAFVLGWQLFEPFLCAAAGLDVDADRRTRVLADGVQRLLERMD